MSDGHTAATTITLSGSGQANSTVTLFDGSTNVGQAAVAASGAWSLQDSGLSVGVHNFTATDTNSIGTSLPSATFPVTIDPSTIPNNPIVNGGFETGDFTGWTLSGNSGLSPWGPQIFITTAAHTGQFAADMGSVGSDGAITENVATTPGQTYTFDFWLQNLGGSPNDFTAKIGGVTELSLVNAAAQPYTHYTYSFTATSSVTPVEFDARQGNTDLTGASTTCRWFPLALLRLRRLRRPASLGFRRTPRR